MNNLFHKKLVSAGSADLRREEYQCAAGSCRDKKPTTVLKLIKQSENVFDLCFDCSKAKRIRDSVLFGFTLENCPAKTIF